MGHREEAQRHLDAAGEAADAWVHIGIAAVHALFDLSDSVQHGLRDIIYELRA